MAEDVVFTFDEQPFVRGIRNSTDAMGDMEDQAQNVNQGIQQSVIGVIAQLAILKTAFEGIKSVINQIPEIGQAFDIAKGIILENFLFPLRQAVLPILQDILDWVRDNRSLFVRWGETVVGIFRVGAQIVRAFGQALGTIFEAIQRVLREVFGFPATFEETINIILFKLSAVAIFLGQLLQPVAEFLSELITTLTPAFEIVRDVVTTVGELVASLTGGFLRGIDGFLEPINGILSAIQDVMAEIFGGTAELETWKGIFETVGTIIGGSIRLGLEIIERIVRTIADLLTPLIEFVREGITNLLDPLFAEGGFFHGLGEFFLGNDQGLQQAPNRGGSPAERRRPTSQAGQNESTLLSAAPLSNQQNIRTEVNINGMTLQVTEGDAEEAGRLFASGISTELTDAVSYDLLREGV